MKTLGRERRPAQNGHSRIVEGEREPDVEGTEEQFKKRRGRRSVERVERGELQCEVWLFRCRVAKM